MRGRYEHPVQVYIPPNGELRGGAWVVIDPTINSKVPPLPPSNPRAPYTICTAVPYPVAWSYPCILSATPPKGPLVARRF